MQFPQLNSLWYCLTEGHSEGGSGALLHRTARWWTTCWGLAWLRSPLSFVKLKSTRYNNLHLSLFDYCFLSILHFILVTHALFMYTTCYHYIFIPSLLFFFGSPTFLVRSLRYLKKMAVSILHYLKLCGYPVSCFALSTDTVHIHVCVHRSRWIRWCSYRCPSFLSWDITMNTNN